MPFPFAILFSYLVIMKSLVVSESTFEFSFTNQLGVIECRRRCQQREECVDIIYTASLLRCTLRMKVTRTPRVSITGSWQSLFCKHNPERSSIKSRKQEILLASKINIRSHYSKTYVFNWDFHFILRSW